MSLFFFNDTATTEIYTLSLHDALPISAAAAAHDVILFDQLAGLAVHAVDADHPAAGDGLGEAPLRILTQTGNSNPLQRRPAVWRIPLLARILRRRNDAALLQGLLANGRGERVR